MRDNKREREGKLNYGGGFFQVWNGAESWTEWGRSKEEIEDYLNKKRKRFTKVVEMVDSHDRKKIEADGIAKSEQLREEKR